MDVPTVATLIILISTAAILLARTLARRRAITLLLWIGLGVLLARWAQYRGAWLELAAALGGSLILVGLWWVIWGRRLPPANDDNIRVWSEDDPF
jgi:hypothetical protein